MSQFRKIKMQFQKIQEFTSKKHLSLINLKLTILMYFEALITNMMMKIPINSIFKVITEKKYF